MKLLRIVLVLVIVLVIGCSSAPRPADECEFDFGAERYRVTREYRSEGEGEYLLWRQDGLTWRLVAAKPAP